LSTSVLFIICTLPDPSFWEKDVVKHKIWVLLYKLWAESGCVVITSNIGRAIGQSGKKEAGSTFVLRV
jgi:hypothetical protein